MGQELTAVAIQTAGKSAEAQRNFAIGGSEPIVTPDVSSPLKVLLI